MSVSLCVHKHALIGFTPALAHISSLDTDLTRNTRAPHFTPAALASVPYEIVLVRVRVQQKAHSHMAVGCCNPITPRFSDQIQLAQRYLRSPRQPRLPDYRTFQAIVPSRLTGPRTKPHYSLFRIPNGYYPPTLTGGLDLNSSNSSCARLGNGVAPPSRGG